MNNELSRPQRRRDFLRVASCATMATVCNTPNVFAGEEPRSLAGVVGITTGGGLGKQNSRGELDLLTLPKYMRDVLGLRLIDVNNRWFDSYDQDFLKRVRAAADAADCFYSNLKVNDPVSGVLYSKDAEERREAHKKCRSLIDSAKILGARWIRFTVPKGAASNPTAHRELAEYAAERDVQMLVENSGWLASQPDSIASLVKAIGTNVAPCPDTGNWDDDIRQQALRNSFPGAVSCDFKVWELDKDRGHARYDLKQCFDIGWQAGYRGPWVMEIMQDDANFADTAVYVRDQLRSWIKENGNA